MKITKQLFTTLDEVLEDSPMGFVEGKKRQRVQQLRAQFFDNIDLAQLNDISVPVSERADRS